LNTSQQIGGAIGVAVAATVATSHATTLLKLGHPAPEAYTSGFALRFWVIAGVAAAGTLAALTLVRREEVPATAEEAFAANGFSLPGLGEPLEERPEPARIDRDTRPQRALDPGPFAE